MFPLAVRFAYDGAAFPRGYARQPEGGTVEDALSPALIAAGMVAGTWRPGSRTDRGVSALENVARCMVDRPHLRGFLPSVQGQLPAGLWITGVARVGDDWNARHASWRQYRYLAPRAGESLAAMRATARLFVGRHDFSGFARLDGRAPEREVLSFTVAPAGSHLWSFRVKGRSFLWNQVRRMVGACRSVGLGEATLADVRRVLQSKQARPSLRFEPAEGLVLERVRYRGLRWATDAGPIVAGHAGIHVAAATGAAQVAGHVGCMASPAFSVR